MTFIARLANFGAGSPRRRKRLVEAASVGPWRRTDGRKLVPGLRRRETIPFRGEMKARLNAKIVTYDDKGAAKPGGMCACRRGGPDPTTDWREEPWFVQRVGFCDSDGVYYACLREGCLEDIREEHERRPQTERDQIARKMTELLGDDLNGAQTMMDDLF